MIGARTRLDALWLLAWWLASSFWCVTAADRLSATFDEPIYLTRGLEFWHTGSHAAMMHAGAMPLPVDVETLPLYGWECWRGQRFDVSTNIDRMLPVARAANLTFWLLLLVYAGRLGRLLAGPWAGRLAVALLACEPNLLAHASLATTDISVTACLLVLIYHFRTGRGAGWTRRVGLPGIAYGLALLAKASGLIWGPLCLLVFEAERLARAGAFARPGPAPFGERLRHVWAAFGPFRRDLVGVAAVGTVLTFAYCGCDWQTEPTFIAWARSLPPGGIGDAMRWLSVRLRIFSNAGEGLIQQIKHNLRGHGSFLLGEWHPRAFWYYFPVALTVKLALPLLLAPPLLLAVRPRALTNAAALTALALLGFSLNCHVQIGIRLVLPLVALLAIGVAVAVDRAYRSFAPGWQRSAVTAGATAAVVWMAAVSARTWPHALCYTNALWGGTSQGYLCLSDSNYDWGQGLKELGEWRAHHGGVPVDVWYYGTDPSVFRSGMRWLPLHATPIGTADDVDRQVRGHYLAVGTTLLYGEPDFTPSARVARQYLDHYRPVDRTTTFLIYDFTRPEPASSP